MADLCRKYIHFIFIRLKVLYILTAISLFALIPLQISRTSSSKTIFKPDDANGENSAQIIFYNRIPKTGSTTFTNAIAYDLCLQNQFHVAHLNLTRNRFQMGRIDQLKLARNVTRWTKMQPLFLHGHVAFINFQSLGLPSPIWINILREPFERFVSHYYFLRYGDNFRVGLKRSKAGNNETFDDCFIRGSKECQPNAIWLQVHYFCGTASFCSEPGSAQALEQAKRHLLDHYLLVGVTERMGEMVELLDQMVPRFFRGAGQHFRTLDTIRAHLRHTTKKVAPSEEVERRFKAHPIYQAEREFYDFAAKEFDAVWRRVTDRGEAKANGKESDDGGGNDDTGMKTKFLLDQFHFEKIRP